MTSARAHRIELSHIACTHDIERLQKALRLLRVCNVPAGLNPTATSHGLKQEAPALPRPSRLAPDPTWPRRLLLHERGVPVESRTERALSVQAALKKVLSDDVTQQGSIVRQDGFRFDFSLPRPMKPKEVEETERLVNLWIEVCKHARVACLHTRALLHTRPAALLVTAFGAFSLAQGVKGAGRLVACQKVQLVFGWRGLQHRRA